MTPAKGAGDPADTLYRSLSINYALDIVYSSEVNRIIAGLQSIWPGTLPIVYGYKRTGSYGADLFGGFGKAAVSMDA